MSGIQVTRMFAKLTPWSGNVLVLAPGPLVQSRPLVVYGPWPLFSAYCTQNLYGPSGMSESAASRASQEQITGLLVPE